jgi:hypothetical protein
VCSTSHRVRARCLQELIVEKIEIEIEGVPTEFLVDKKQVSDADSAGPP